MTNYVLLYTGGGGMGASEEEVAAIMADWGAWYGKIGEAVVDGGNPFSASMHVNADGVNSGAATTPEVTGYTIISAESLDAAVDAVKDHPHIKHGGQVTVHETFQM
jgi:hypothetical protein